MNVELVNLCLLDSSNNVHEGSLQRGPAHKKTVDIRACKELAAVIWGAAASILNTNRIGNRSAGGFRDDIPASLVGVLSLLLAGDDAGTDGPDGLVSNDNLGPIRNLGNHRQ